MFRFILFYLPMHSLAKHFVLSLLYLVVKGEQDFASSSCMFLDRKTLLKIWFNPGLNHLSRNRALLVKRVSVSLIEYKIPCLSILKSQEFFPCFNKNLILKALGRIRSIFVAKILAVFNLVSRFLAVLDALQTISEMSRNSA